MIWKGVGILGAAAVLVIVLVLGMAQLTVPDEPTFAEGFEEAAASPEDFVPSAAGGVLEVTGAREGLIELEEEIGGPSFGLGDGLARIFFTGAPLAIGQMSYDGLAFFPEPEDCEFAAGEHNEEAGLVAVQITCPELVDIRDNGSIALEGFAALPADLVIDLDLPDTGGTVTVGDEEWEIVDPLLFIGPRFLGDDMTANEFLVWTRDARKGLGFTYNDETGTMSLVSVYFEEGPQDVDSTDCSLMDDEVMTVNPQTQFRELTINCESVDVPGLGTVGIAGALVYEKAYLAEP